MFNSDAVPDLLVRINYGVWNKYNHSTIAILDGQNGDVLWSFDSVKTGMMSSLSLAALTPGADIALFITMGTTGSHSNTSQVYEQSLKKMLKCVCVLSRLTGGER